MNTYTKFAQDLKSCANFIVDEKSCVNLALLKFSRCSNYVNKNP
jgi:hypothetical protein